MTDLSLDQTLEGLRRMLAALELQADPDGGWMCRVCGDSWAEKAHGDNECDALMDRANLESALTLLSQQQQDLTILRARVQQDATLKAEIEGLELQASQPQQEIARLTQELAGAIAALDEWAPLDEGEAKTLAQRIRDEGHDFAVMCGHTSRIYDYVTHGRISKPMTLPSVVIAESDHLLSQDIDEAVKEETKELQAEIQSLTSRLEAKAQEIATLESESWQEGWLRGLQDAGLRSDPQRAWADREERQREREAQDARWR